MVFCACVVLIAPMKNWSPFPANGRDFVHRTAGGVWRRRRLIWSTMSCLMYPCANGYCHCRYQCGFYWRSPSDEDDDPPYSATTKRISWARLLKRVFDIDIEQCPHCGGTLKIIAAILESGAITKILDHLGLPARAPPRSSAQVFNLF